MAQKSTLYTATKNIPIDLDSDVGWDILSGDSQQEKADIRGMFAAVPWLYRGLVLRANAVASMPWRLMKGEKEIDSSANYQNVENILPNPSRFLWLIEASLTLEGRAYAWKGINAAKYPTTLRYWKPNSVRINFQKDDLGSYTGEYSFKRGQREYPSEDVFHYWPPDPTVELGPADASPGVAALAASGVIYSVDEFARLFAERGFVKAFILSVKGLSDPKERDRMESWFNRFMRGVKQMGIWKVFNADTTAVTTVGDGFKEIESSNITNSRREDIAAALGIPMSMLFSGSAAGLGGGGVASQDEINFYKQTIIPELKPIAEAMNEQVWEPFGCRMEFLDETLDIFQADSADQQAALSSFLDNLPKCPTYELAKAAFTQFGIEISADLDVALKDYYAKKEENAAKLQEQLAGKPADNPQAGEEQQNGKPADAEQQAENTTPEPVKSDLRRWQTKALKAFEKGESPNVRFTSDEIPTDMMTQIRAQLAECKTAEAVKAVFGKQPAPADPILLLVEELRASRAALKEAAVA